MVLDMRFLNASTTGCDFCRNSCKKPPLWKAQENVVTGVFSLGSSFILCGRGPENGRRPYEAEFIFRICDSGA